MSELGTHDDGGSQTGGGGGTVGPLVGAKLFIQGTFILNEIWAQDKIYILVGTLLG
jgi:hypothetical protein